jgi:hypothetical protein
VFYSSHSWINYWSLALAFWSELFFVRCLLCSSIYQQGHYTFVALKISEWWSKKALENILSLFWDDTDRATTDDLKTWKILLGVLQRHLTYCSFSFSQLLYLEFKIRIIECFLIHNVLNVQFFGKMKHRHLTNLDASIHLLVPLEVDDIIETFILDCRETQQDCWLLQEARKAPWRVQWDGDHGCNRLSA